MARVINVGEKAYEGGGEYQPIPEGTRVVATVYSIEEVPVKSGDNAGKSQLDVTFKVQGGQWAGREIRYQKIPLYDGGGAWKLVTFAEAVGWKTKPTIELPDNLQSVLGKSLTIKVSVEPPRNGRTYNSVSGYANASVGEQAVAEAAPDAVPSWGTLG